MIKIIFYSAWLLLFLYAIIRSGGKLTNYERYFRNNIIIKGHKMLTKEEIMKIEDDGD